jgi:hypothetical protein
MQPEDSVQCLQESATYLYAKPDYSNPYRRTLFLYDLL